MSRVFPEIAHRRAIDLAVAMRPRDGAPPSGLLLLAGDSSPLCKVSRCYTISCRIT